ncbi:agmatinase [Denitrovibrio acetiphilus DSM 12809]|uniref:Agmatinase n=1 Tax=Denitrovibrio acetiphilus (strain DSM 12809 / NBRC 114555 / N2460) TaxID=522772 RepID=D4H500_DENA2|nr:agmatinase [Denitrovibrio acetiphilus]ADD69356.1 agmatinase [Denitrovibrio acetiphilus DSM 12809]
MNEILNFHGDDVTPSAPEEAYFHVIPVPYEQTVSFGVGTAEGPEAILKTSAQLETFDSKSIPAELGIYTAPPVDCTGAIKDTLLNITSAVNSTLQMDKTPVVLGGEHTVTYGVIEALYKKYGKDFCVVQFDAHADLRDSYDGTKFSHACVMKRIFDLDIPFYQLGTRSYSIEEHNLRLRHNIHFMDAEELCSGGDETFVLPPYFPKNIFITFDIDALDAAIMPATGTPVPGGLGWYQSLKLIEKALSGRKCIGFDVVEFSPIEGFHGYDFTAAQLVYNIMGIIHRS